ncbi:MAG: hypothetical protein ABUK01_18470 [Leptospirales bacterium]
MFKIIQSVITIGVLLTALTYFGFIEFTDKGKESIETLKTEIQDQVKNRLAE